MSTTARFLVATLIVLAAAALPAPAVAATTGWQRVNVTLQGESQPVLLIAGELPEIAKLPHEGELAVPAGMHVEWVGEILGGASAQDPAMKYTKTTVDGLDIYRFTLTKSRIAQVEGTVEAPGGFDGKTYTSALKWTAWQALPEVRINKQVPAGAQIVQAAPGASLLPADANNSYYTKSVKNVKAGDVVDLTFTYTVPPAGSSAATVPTAGSSGSNDVVVYVVLGVLIIAIAFFAFQVRRKSTAGRAAKAGPSRKQSAVSKQDKPSKQSAASKQSAVSETKVAQEAPASEEPEAATDDSAPSRSKKVSPAIATLVIVGVLVGVTVIAARVGTTPKVTEGKMTRQFGTASPCTSMTIPVVAESGVDLGKQGDKLLSAFEGKQGVTDVTINLEESTVDIGFCESEQSDATLRQILTGTGLVEAGPPVAKPATPGAGEGQ